jgi:hypothetical protein
LSDECPRYVDPPLRKSKAPDPAATGSSASKAYLAGQLARHTSGTRQRIAGTLRLRFGGAA